MSIMALLSCLMGRLSLVTKLNEGLHATVLQLPANTREIMPEAQNQELLEI
jgi:hypothetical protein